jgi:hypothetical protein
MMWQIHNTKVATAEQTRLVSDARQRAEMAMRWHKPSWDPYIFVD